MNITSTILLYLIYLTHINIYKELVYTHIHTHTYIYAASVPFSLVYV